MEGQAVSRLTGVYHADGGWRGELAYVVGRARGTAHCALCDVTHSPVRRKRAFDELVGRLGVAFDLVHLNERSPALRALTEGGTPCVVAHPVDAAALVVLGPVELDALGGDVAAFEAALRSALAARGLALPALSG